ncbi:carbohydrate ABC transporter permease [Paenibacillus chungangensis]|uniref:Carbohydrate ABC transporter permease n=1 Tax=Paenibacillus chungangensis TaxID=696535 RepID=A0ABW3HT76_9BACL
MLMKLPITKRGIFIAVMLAWPLLHYGVFGLYLQIQTLLYSFQFWNPLTGKRTWVGFDNYVSAFKGMANDVVWISAIKNSLLFIPVNLMTLAISFVVALILHRRLPFARFYRVVYFFPSIISIVVITMVFSFSLNPTQGIVNGLLGLLGLEEWQRAWLGDTKTALLSVFVFYVWVTIGWNNVIITGSLQRIPTDFFEVGKLDGIGFWKELFSIVVPSAWPAISTLLILGTSGAFTIFLQPLLLTNGGPFSSSTTVALEMYRLVVEKNSYGLAAAYGMIFALLGFVVVWSIKWLTERYETSEF